jgi:hypothetical protein
VNTVDHEPLTLPLNRMAAQARVPAPWLKAQALSGRIPCLQFGRRLLFCVAAVEKALAEMAEVSFCQPKLS